MTESKNSKVLASFTKYCQEHPEQRFWQALSNWSGYLDIMVMKDVGFKGKRIERFSTFYWEGKNK